MKFAISLVLGCFLFGFLKFAASDFHTREDDLADSDDLTDEPKDTNRTGAVAVGIAVNAPNVNNNIFPVQLVECYVCSDCKEVYANTSTKLCPYTQDPTKQNHCVKYSEHFKYLKKQWYIRGCASERGTCADIKKAHAAHSDIVKLMDCSECEGDRCNGAVSHSVADLTMAVFVMMITPLIAKYTLS